jgi:hypothetical protein
MGEEYFMCWHLEHEQSGEWIRKKTRAFDGQSAVDTMLAGDLKSIRKY